LERLSTLPECSEPFSALSSFGPSGADVSLIDLTVV